VRAPTNRRPWLEIEISAYDGKFLPPSIATSASDAGIAPLNRLHWSA